MTINQSLYYFLHLLRELNDRVRELFHPEVMFRMTQKLRKKNWPHIKLIYAEAIVRAK